MLAAYQPNHEVLHRLSIISISHQILTEGVAHHLHQKGIFDESKQQAFVMSLHILALLGKLCASLSPES